MREWSLSLLGHIRPIFPRIERQPSCLSERPRGHLHKFGIYINLVWRGSKAPFFGQLELALFEAHLVHYGFPEQVLCRYDESLIGSPICGAASATPYSSLASSFFMLRY